MTHNFFAGVAVIALCSGTVHAEQSHWWILVKSEHRCVDAATFAEEQNIPEFADPYALAKLTDGKIEEGPGHVIVYPFQGKRDLVNVFLPQRELCEAQLSAPETTTACGSDPLPACPYDDVDVPPAQQAPSKPAWTPRTWAEQHAGLTTSEIKCLNVEAVMDGGYVAIANSGVEPPKGYYRSPDPIKKCAVDVDRIPRAMDLLIDAYQNPGRGSRGAPTWVESHCKAVPAIPRNKWVCTYNGVTREFR